MEKREEGFLSAVRHLGRSPIGVIALFLGLIYVVAGLVLGVGGGWLSPTQKWVFVVYLVAFPITILGTFVWLVVKHPGKLYAPGDYKDDINFLRALSPREQAEHLRRQISEQSLAGLSHGDAAGQGTIASAPEVSLRQAKRPIDDMMLAIDLAIRDVEWDLGVSVRRGTSISSIDAVTGVFHNGKSMVFMEVYYYSDQDTKESEWVERVVDLCCARNRTIAHEIHVRPISCLFAIVVEYGSQGQLEHLYEELDKALKDAPLPCEVRPQNFQMLKSRFTIGLLPNKAMDGDEE